MAGLGAWLWDALFPRACVVCGDEGSILCALCTQKEVKGMWHRHAQCESGDVWTQYAYRDATLRALLHAWKYQGDAEAGKLLCARFTNAIPLRLRTCDAVVPVPLAREAHAERGFNQAKLLAGALARAGGVPVYDMLGRYPKRAQAKTAKEDRGHVRVQNPYYLLSNAKKIPQSIALVDDVFTTGSTVLACADVLFLAGVRNITVFTLAHGSPS